MASEWFALMAAVAVFGAICGAYALVRSGKRRLSSGQELNQIHQYTPPIHVVLEYRNKAGIKLSQRVAVLKSLRHDDGRLLLLGFLGSHEPRTFHVDRIVSVATVDGENIDTRAFLTDWLAIPPKLSAAQTA